MAFFESAFVIANGLICSWLKVVFQSVENSSCHCRWQGRNQIYELESGSFSVDRGRPLNITIIGGHACTPLLTSSHPGVWTGARCTWGQYVCGVNQS